MDNQQQIARNFCAVSALGSAINYLDAANIATRTDGGIISVGELVEILLLANNKPYQTIDPDNSQLSEVHQWKGFTMDGGSYHQALISLAEGLELSAASKGGFPSIESFKDFLDTSRHSRTALLLSVGNKFVNDITLQLQGRSPVGLAEGTHVICILGFDNRSGLFTIFDPFGNQETLQVSAGVLDKYLAKPSKVVALARRKEDMELIANIRSNNVEANMFVSATVRALNTMRRAT